MKTASAVLALALAAPCHSFAPSVSRTAALRPACAQRAASSMKAGGVEQVEVDVVSPGPKKAALDSKASELKDSAKELADQFKAAVNGIDSRSVVEDLKAAYEGAGSNIQEGKAGERGEVLAAVPYVILSLLVAGNLPFLGGPLELLAGPGLLTLGLGGFVISILQLGKNLSPWTVPSSGNVLKTTGVYSLCRHPMYASLVAAGFGLGFATDSFTRIALAALLLYVFDKKATAEEAALVQLHPAYKTYQEEVAKFFPLLDNIKLEKK